MGDNGIITREYFPGKFFNKEINEPFIKTILSRCFDRYDNWREGNPNMSEPDYFMDDIPFEFTIACDKEVHDTFIVKLRAGEYTSNDVENDIFEYIKTSINKKSAKKYSVKNINLAILISIDMFNWVLDVYGSTMHALIDYRRKQFFEEMKQAYIDSKKFANIFVIFPDICKNWWVYDMKTDKRKRIGLTEEEIKSGRFPYIETIKAE